MSAFCRSSPELKAARKLLREYGAHTAVARTGTHSYTVVLDGSGGGPPARLARHPGAERPVDYRPISVRDAAGLLAFDGMPAEEAAGLLREYVPAEAAERLTSERLLGLFAQVIYDAAC